MDDLSADPAILDLWPHPVTADGRRTVPVIIDTDTRPADLARRYYDGHPSEVEIVLDGEILPPEHYDLPVPPGTRQIMLRPAPSGDDFGRLILSIAVIVLAVVVPPALGLAAGTLGAALVSAGISIVGGLLANALFPVRAPDLGGPGDRPAAEPVYSLTGGANRLRPYEPLPLVIGRHRIFPDLAAREYTEYEDGDQYLYQIFNFGLGDLDIEDIGVGSTPLEDLSDVSHQVVRDSPITIVAGNVDTIAGAGEVGTSWASRSTSDLTDRIAVDLVAQLYRVDDEGDLQDVGVTIQVGWRVADSSDPFEEIERQFTNRSQSPLTRSILIQMPSRSAWEIRVRRTDDPEEDARIRNRVDWTALRTYQPDNADYRGQTRLGLKVRASNQLSGRLDRVSAVAHLKIPIYQGGAWTNDNHRTRNPAAIFRWYCRGLIGQRGLSVGVGLPDRRIDHATLGRWYDWCADKGLNCDFAIQTAMTHDALLDLIAQCGRAAKTWSTGKLGVIYEDERRAETGLVTPGNVLAGTFRVVWAAGGRADEIVVRFIDPEMDWQYNSVRRTRPGLTGAPVTTATITARGVTDRDHAAIECNLTAANQSYHPRQLIWEMGREGRAFVKGDVVLITHSLIDGGQAGRVEALSGSQLTLDREVNVSNGDFIVLRRSDGRLHKSQVNRSGSGPTRILTLITPAEAPDDAEPQDVLWRIYDVSLPPVRARILATEPLSDRRFRFTARDEVSQYHDAATSDLSVPLLPRPSQAPRIMAAIVSETLVLVGSGYLVELELVLTVAGDWRGGTVTVSIDDGPSRVTARMVDGEITARWTSPASGVATIQIIPGSRAAPTGAAYTVVHQIVGLLAPPGLPTNFLIDVLGDGTRRLRWTPPRDPDLAGIVIRYAEAATDPPVWEQMTPLHNGYLTASPFETVEPREGRWVFAARAVDTGGRVSEGDVRIIAEIGPQRSGNGLLWRCPSALGWPGGRADAIQSNDGRDALEGSGLYRWADLTTWQAWTSWGLGDGQQGTTSMVYVDDPQDIGAQLTFDLTWTADVVGDVVFEIRTAVSPEDITTATWSEYTPSTLVTARIVQVRWRLTGGGDDVLSLDHLCWSINAPAAVRRLLDVDTSSWAGSPSAGRTVPHDLALVTDLDVTLQSVGAGWSWSLHSKNPTIIRIFDGDGDPADAVIDMIVRGITRR